MYKPYLNYEEYREMGGTELPEADAGKILKNTSRHIDTLTFNRIQKQGFENLTDFQKEIIKEVCFDLSEFEFENDDLLNSPFSSYSINGVSMSLDKTGMNLITQNGVVIKSDLYDRLKQTGLTTLSFAYEG